MFYFIPYLDSDVEEKDVAEDDMLKEIPESKGVL